MSISLPFASKSTGDKLTATEANAVATATTYALDKRSGQTDTLASIVSCSGAGRLRPTYVAGANADTTYTLSDGNSVIDASTGLSASRIYTLSNTGAAAGDLRTVLGSAASWEVTVKNHGGTTLIVLPIGGWADFIHNGTNWILLRSAATTASSTYTAARGSIRSSIAEVQTSSTTTTTILSFTMTDETLCLFDFAVTCALRTNVTKGGSYKGTVTYRRTGVAAPALVGSAVYQLDQETTAGDGVVFDVSSNDVRVRVTAADSDPRNWLGELRVQEVTNA